MQEKAKKTEHKLHEKLKCLIRGTVTISIIGKEIIFGNHHPIFPKLGKPNENFHNLTLKAI